MNESPPIEPKTQATNEPGQPANTGDDSLILWMLSLTPTERLQVAQGFVNSIQALRAGRRA